MLWSSYRFGNQGTYVNICLKQNLLIDFKKANCLLYLEAVCRCTFMYSVY